jgi:hypothetical protein
MMDNKFVYVVHNIKHIWVRVRVRVRVRVIYNVAYLYKYQ